MKNIWIDGYEANVDQRVGSGQVAVSVLEALSKIDKSNNYTIALPSPPLEDMPKESSNWSYKVLKPSRLWTWLALPMAIRFAKPRPDLVFSPTHYIPRVNVKRIVMIFDLAYLKFPNMFLSKDLYKLTNWTKYSIENADHIITISNSTKKDIHKFFGTPNQKITVAYPGFDSDLFKVVSDKEHISRVLSKYKITGQYVIYIGTIQLRKNLMMLMDAIKEIADLKLVVVGKTKGLGRQAWMFEETINYPQKIGISDRVVFTGFAPYEDLPYLLAGSRAYVLPSLYEGFGIPVVEAMACGVPVVVSNVSSLPEVVGKAGLLFDPENLAQLVQAIRSVLTDQKLSQKLSKMSLVQSTKFSWENMAKICLDVFEKV